MQPDEKLVAQVEAILRRRKSANTAPDEVDLTPVVDFLSPTYPRATREASSSSRPSKPPDTHWYCPRSASPVVRDAATFLIFLFAFQSAGTTSWIEALEDVLKGCDKCARGFGAARRTFLSSYLSKFNATVQTNFFNAVDKWQINFILSEYKALKASSSSSSPLTLTSISSSFIQLVLSDSKFLKNVEIHNILNKTVHAAPDTPQPKICALGLTPGLLHLLGSQYDTMRKWATAQLRLASQRPLPLDKWKDTGIAAEFQRLCSDIDGISSEDRWKIVLALIESGGFSKGAIQGGVLGVEKGGSKGLMAALCPLLGSDLPYFSTIFGCFIALLQISPTHHIWSFDTSPELPHTLFSDIKNNPAFLNLLQFQFFSVDATKEGEGSISALGWMSDFLLSLTDPPDGKNMRDHASSGFSEALAKVLNFCFSELQHERFEQPLRASAARTGFEVFSTLQAKLQREDSAQQSSLFSALDIHAAFISNVALRSADHPDRSWNFAGVAARQVLLCFFKADGKDIIEIMLFLAVIAVGERKRVKKQKQKKPVDAPVKVGKFHRASIRKALWTTAYNTILPSDPIGVSIMLQSIASFAHLDKLDRSASWSHTDLGEVISSDDWVSGVRAVNQSMHLAREPFGRIIQAIASQPDPAILQQLWKQPDAAKSAIICLLSPADDVHDPIISLIQQSFEDVDDRGDCFRILLQQFPDQAMDGLCTFLSSFVITANKTPESCSLAKWLVRCFTDILEALCQPSLFGEALLHSDEFLGVNTGGIPMSRRVADLWSQMTTSLAVILKRTPEWAPYFDNAIMVDWMRDALIFGRQMTEHIRIFEAAALGESGTESIGSLPMESPVKVTSTGKKMIQQLDVVLRDLVSWLRLTDVETLHQTFELVKTILQRISRGSTDVDPSTKETLLELDKFCRKVSKSYNTRLSDDLLSELSDLLSPFNLGGDDDASDTVSVGAPPALERTASADSAPRPIPDRQPGPSKPPPKDAFAIMMQSSASSSTTPAGSKLKSKSGASRADAIAIDDFEDDFLDSLSAKDLDIIEKRAVVSRERPAPPAPKASTSRPLPLPAVPTRPTEKLNVNVVPRPAAPPASKPKFKSQLMRDLHREQRQFSKDTFGAPVIGGISHRLPAASGLGTGLGAHQPKGTVPALVDSGSSASDSSEDEGTPGLAIARKQKSPLKPARTIVAAPRVYQRPVESLWERQQREKEEQRRRQINIKRRLKPDLTPLYRTILAWNPQHTGSNAPHFAQGQKFTTIPATFLSATDYTATMLPLFEQELWAQCIKDQVTDPIAIVEIGGRSYEDDFLDIDLSLPNGAPPKFQLHDSDIVILKQAGNPRQVFAKVQGFQRNFAKGAIKIRMLQKMDINGLAAKTRWQLQKHISLSTALREYAALAGLPYYEDNLLLDILRGRSATFPTQSADTIARAQKAYDVNEPQAKAILGAMTINGFALIQGPPGTGKTKTISGLVGRWMSTRAAAIAQPGSERPMKAKLLVCAPSNAAIDEVCKRLMNGVPSSSGDRLVPNIVRIGVDASVNDAVKDISLDNLVEAKVAIVSASRGGTDYDKIQRELEEVKTKIREKQDQLRQTSNQDAMYGILGTELQALITKRTQLGQASSKAKDAARDATRHLDAARRAAREAVLNDADIICATLSGSGQDSLSSYTFETVIIDEAAQAIEMSCLIPLKYGCRRCIMVGDPIQLPPTTFSTEADKYHFNESLFVRMTKQSSANVQLLSIQYRMHPYISELPSKVFYDSRLKDGPDMAKKTAAVWHSRFVFGAYRFFNVSGVEVKQGTSTKNPEEARVAVELYQRLAADFSDKIDLSFRIGVITMYREQLYEMKQAFNRVFGEAILQRIEFNTVDGFQGQEKDIIILSCVRSGPNLSSIGFLKDPRRMNVALTRAKSSLWVIGNGPTLERSDERWRTIVGDARERGFFINYDANTFARPPSPEPGEIPPPPPPVRKRPRTDAGASPVKRTASTTASPAAAAASTSAGPSKKPLHIGAFNPTSSPAPASSTAGSSRKLIHIGSAINATRPPAATTSKTSASTSKATPGDLKRKSSAYASTTSIAGPSRKKLHPSSPSDSSDTSDSDSTGTTSSDSDSPPPKPSNVSSKRTVPVGGAAPAAANGSKEKKYKATPLAMPPIRPAMARPPAPAPAANTASSSRPLPPNGASGANGAPSRPRPPPTNGKPEDSLFIKKKKKKPGNPIPAPPSASPPIRQKLNNQLPPNPRRH